MSLAKRLFCIIALNIAIVLLTSVVAFWGVSRLANSSAVQDEFSVGLENHMQGDMMHDALRADVLSALYSSSGLEEHIGNQEEITKELKEHAENFRTVLAKNRKLNLGSDIRRQLDDVAPLVETYINSAESLVADTFKDHAKGVAQYPQFIETFKKLESSLGTLSENIQGSVSKLTEEDKQTVPQVKGWLITVLCLAIAMGTLSLVVLHRTVTKAIGIMIQDLRGTSAQVVASANQVSSSSQALAQGAPEQAASLEQSAASLTEVSSVSKHNTDNSNEANQLTEKMRSAAQIGVKQMHAMTEAIHAIKKSADETEQIVKIIDEIAFQTNLLALNAAVEAARAGDAGKGFAVVAEEVRNLAQRSANAAKESSEKIRQSKELADNGVKVTSEVAKSLEGINQHASKSADIVKEIASASKEQTRGVSEVNTAIAELEKVTHQNSASAEESAAAAEELNAQASSLDGVVRNLSTLVYGAGEQVREERALPRRVPEQKRVRPEQKSRPQMASTKVTYLKHSEKESRASIRNEESSDDVVKLKPTQIIPLDDQEFQGF